MAKTNNRKINLWINGKQVTNNISDIRKSMRKLIATQNKMTIGSKEYVAASKKIKNLKKTIDAHNQSLGRMKQGWARILQEIKTVATGNLISNLLGTIISKVAGAFQKITESIKDFQKGITNTFTLLSQDDIKKFGDNLKKGALDIADFGFAADDVNLSLFDTISAGTEAGNAIGFMSESSRLAIGGVTELATATDGLTTVTNSFKLTAGETANVADAFFTAQKFGKTNVEQLSNSIGRAAPIFASLGGKYQELLSAGSALTLNGIRTKEAFTNLKAVFSNLLKPAGESAKVLKELGIPIGATEIKTVGFTETLARLSKAMQAHPNEITKAITSTEALTAVTALSGEGFEKYKEILQAVNTDIGEGSSLSKAYEMQQDTIAMTMARMKAGTTRLAIEIGEKLLPFIKGIISALSGLTKKLLSAVDWIVVNIDTFKLLGKALISIISGITAYTVAIKIQNTWTKIVTVSQNLYRQGSLLLSLAHAKLTGNTMRAAIAQKKLNISMKANPLGIVITLITTLVTLYLTFKQRVENSNKAVANFNKELATQKKELNDVFEALKTTHKGTKARKELIIKINKEYGKYLPNLLTERSTLREIETAQTAANKALAENIAIKMKQNAIEESYSKSITKQTDIINKVVKWGTKKNAHLTKIISNEFQALVKTADETKKLRTEGILDTYEFTPKTNAKITAFYKKYLKENEGFLRKGKITFKQYIKDILLAEKRQFEEIDRINASFSGYITTKKRDSYQRELMLERNKNITNLKTLKRGTQEYEAETQRHLKKLKEIREFYGKSTEPQKTKEPKNDGFTSDTGETKETISAFQKYLTAYEKLQIEFQKLTDKEALNTKTKHQIEIDELNAYYNKLIDTQSISITALEELGKEATKEELALLQMLYVQKENITKKHQSALAELLQKHEDEKQQARKKAQTQINNELKNDYEREYETVNKHYDELIKLAEDFNINIETINKLRDEKAVALDAIDFKYGSEDTDLFGFTQSDYDKLKDNFDKILTYIDALSNAWSNYNNLKRVQDEKEITRIEENYNQRTANIQKLYDARLISEATLNSKLANLERKKDEEKRNILLKQAQREQNLALFEAVINTAAGVVKAIPNPYLMAFAALAGGLQIAAIEAEPLPKLAKGARINKPMRAEIGEEGPEILFSNKMITDPQTGPILNYLADIQEGKARTPQSPTIPNFTAMRAATAQTSNYNHKIINNYNQTPFTIDYSSLETKLDKLIDLFKKGKTVRAEFINDEFQRFQTDNTILDELSRI